MFKFFTPAAKLARLQKLSMAAISIFQTVHDKLEKLITKIETQADLTIAQIEALEAHHTGLQAQKDANTKIMNKIKAIIEN